MSLPIVPQKVDLYWQQFLASLASTAETPTTYWGSNSFGFTEEDARDIAALVLAGTKTATGSLLWSYEADGKRVPRAGDYWIVTKGPDDPVCLVQTTEIRVIPFDQVTVDYARDGGEGDRSLEGWHEMYWRYILAECARIGRAPSEQAPLVMERFRVVYREPFRSVAWPGSGPRCECRVSSLRVLGVA